MIIRGAGGGDDGGSSTPSPPVPNESPNTLFSKSTGRIVDLLCEGPIEGLANGLQSVYLNDTPLQNSSGGYNFSGASVYLRKGEPDQDFIPGFPSVETEVAVGVELTPAVHFIRQITDSNATAVRIKIRVPQLSYTDLETGNITGTAVSFAIAVQPSGGSYTNASLVNTANPVTISGKTTSVYEASYRVELPAGGSPWNIRITRNTPAPANSQTVNTIFWSTYTVVIDNKFQYNNTAVIGVTVDRQAFGQEIPTRAYDIKGLKVKIPSNYDPDTRAYTGIWDGTFQTAWTDNPAWVLYDMIINNRYGLGEYVAEEQLDKYSLYEIAQYNDELVPDGQGGTEPRFTFNGVIHSARDAFDVLNAVASNFRSMIYWNSGGLAVVQDSPRDVDQLVSPANVIDGHFNYSGTALNATHSAALVSWNDPDDSYKLNIAVVEDNDLIYRIGWRKLDTAAIGCTSAGQALRFGKWILDTEQNETETVTYTAGLDHAGVFPGQIIHIADPHYANVRYGGRVVSWYANELTIDQAVDLQTGETYTLTVMLEDGSVGEYEVTNSPGETDTLTLDEDIDAVSGDPVPVAGAMWILSGTDVEPRPFRVIAVREIEKHRFEVTALFHDETKYDRVENNIIVEPPDFTAFPSGVPAAPTNMTFNEYLYLSAGTIKSAIDVSWSFSTDPRALYYEVYVQDPNSEDYRILTSTTGNSATVLDNTNGTYLFKVRAVEALGGLKSEFLEGSYEAGGILAPPSDVENFRMSILDSVAYLSWDPVTDLDLDHYTIRFSPETSGVTWGSSATLVETISSSMNSITVPAMVGTYSIKAVDFSGVESENATFIQSTITEVNGLNVVEVLTEHPDFPGEKVDTQVLSSLLKLDPQDTVDDYEDIDYVDNFDYGTDPEPVDEGYYYFEEIVDLGAIFTSRITPSLVAYGENYLSNVDFWTNFDSISNVDGSEESDWQVKFQISTTTEDPTLSDASWSDYTDIIIGDYTARAYQFRLILLSLLAGVSPVVEQASVSVDMPDRVASGEDLTIPAVGLNVTFSPAFKETPAIAATVENMDTGDYVEITNKSSTGFTIRVFNSVGSGVERTFDYIARGYGYVAT